MKYIEKLFKFLSSLKLAVLIIVSLGIMSGWGTIVESNYDMITAQKTIYHSKTMYFILFMLIVNLVAVAVDRLPWGKKHIGFVMAHAGIIILLLGSYVTRTIGIDGSLVFDVGESERYVSLTETDLTVYRLKNLEESEKIYQQDVEFLVESPKDHPIVIPLDKSELSIVDYMPYAQKSFKIQESNMMMDGPALRFQISNPFVNVTEWVVQTGSGPAKLNLGPAQIVLSRDDSYKTLGGLNEIVLWPHKNGKQLEYVQYNKEGVVQKKGRVGFSEEFDTGWMGLKFRTLQYYPKARVQYEYQPLERPNATSVSAAKINFNGQDYWLGLNTALELFDHETVYFITYGNKRIDLGFSLTLDKFEVEKYQGTEMAASYKSIVTVPELGVREISMNEPLKYKGYTFYQASFQQDRMGNPVGSILTVNRDPGRFWKYLGSFLIISGSIVLFYFKKRLAKIQKKSGAANA
jgi:hypothetical protein